MARRFATVLSNADRARDRSVAHPEFMEVYRLRGYLREHGC